jgi:enoyl-CoA hydratase/carnithine racemase
VSDLVLEHPADGVVTLVMTRPAVRNALTTAMCRELPRVLRQLAGDANVRAVVLTGAGGAFSAGADLDDLDRLPGGADEHAALLLEAFDAVRTIRGMPQPVIAAIEGPAVGGGLGLALACDIRLASADARFGAPFIHMGLIPDYGLTATLPRLAGAAAALELLLSGRYVDAAEALELGLATRVVDDPVRAAVELGAAFASGPPQAAALTKRLVYGGLASDIGAAIRTEATQQAHALRGPEFAEHFDRWRAQVQSNSRTGAAGRDRRVNRTSAQPRP